MSVQGRNAARCTAFAVGAAMFWTGTALAIVPGVSEASLSQSDMMTVEPARLLDTRPTGTTVDGEYAATGKVLAGAVARVQVAGRGAVPVGATGVEVNLAAIQATGTGFATLYPCSVEPPVASSLNFSAGVNIANATTVGLNSAGEVCLYTSSSAHFAIDVVAFVPAGSDLVTVKPARLLETRADGMTVDGVSAGVGKAAAGEVIRVQVSGRGGVPRNATGAELNVAAIRPEGNGFATLYPCSVEPPVASSLNFSAGVNIANATTVGLNSAGEVCLYTSSSAHFAIDVVAFVPAGSDLVTVKPARLLETRADGMTVDGVSAGVGKAAAGEVIRVQVSGRGGVPRNATGAELNVAAIRPEGNGFATLYPCSVEPPVASSLNFSAGVNIANATTVGLNSAGEVCLYTSSSAHFAIDVVASIAPPQCPDDGSLTIDSHTNGQVVDTSGAGTASGSVVLRGRAPLSAAAVLVDVAGEVGNAEVSVVGCLAAWSIEAIVDENERRTFTVSANGARGTDTRRVTLDLVAPAPEDVLLDPKFSQTEQHDGDLVVFDEATGTLTFAGDVTANMRIGDGLVSDPVPLAPAGYLKVVTAFEFDGATTVVMTRDAGLTEYVRQIDVSFYVPPGTNDPMEFLARIGSGAANEIAPPPLLPTASQLASDDFEFEANLTLDPGFQVDIDIDFRRDNCTWCVPKVIVDRIFFEAGIEIGVEAEFTYRGLELFQDTDSFGPRFDDFQIGAVVIPLPVGAITIEFEVEGQAFYEVNVDAAVKLEYGLGISIVAGYEYRGDGAGRGAYRNSSFTGGLAGGGPEFKAGLSATVAAGIEMDLEALLWGQAGFEIEARPKIELEAFADLVALEIPWKLQLVVPFDASLEIEIDLGPIDYDKEFGNIEFLRLQVVLFEGRFELAGDPSDDVVGDGVEVVDDDIDGSFDQWGKVDGFVPGERSWVLSTGNVADAVGPASDFASTDLGQSGDAALTALAGFETRDAAAYTTTVIPEGGTLHVRYAFASEEYPDYVGSEFNDVMAVFVGGTNCALVPGTQIPVSVNTINIGSNAEFYVDNSGGAAGYGTSMNGLTTPLTCSVPVTPGQAVVVRITVADASDGVFDSAVALLDGGIWSS
ncbi:MAG: choice-of-anchor L domain-containing protein [Ilumatobacter sp.]|uniref:choice-of-anchor L domain-containing protein n=1 Tax=Ilumatobacter sp. TaxID=1967498 RepID=UPI00391A41F2